MMVSTWGTIIVHTIIFSASLWEIEWNAYYLKYRFFTRMYSSWYSILHFLLYCNCSLPLSTIVDNLSCGSLGGQYSDPEPGMLYAIHENCIWYQELKKEKLKKLQFTPYADSVLRYFAAIKEVLVLYRTILQRATIRECWNPNQKWSVISHEFDPFSSPTPHSTLHS